MLIGTDYDKIAFDYYGLNLLEPNAFIGDAILFTLAIFFAFRTHHLKQKSEFFTNWKWFFVVFGLGFFIGGLGHLFFNYWGIPGRYASWFLGILSSYFAERAMISIYPNPKVKRKLQVLIKIKLGLAFLAETLVLTYADLSQDISIGLIVTIISTTIGSLYVFGYLGVRYSREICTSFKFLWISVLLVFPTILLQAFKINVDQWFDRNDASHIFLILGLFFYYKSIKGYYKFLGKEARKG